MKEENAQLYVHEIFPSFQGEGLYCGVPQVFVRLSGCNLSCAYCDTPLARGRGEAARIWDWDGERDAAPNPLDTDALAEVVASLWTEGMHSVSITGGEPLVQAEALAPLLSRLKERSMPIYLETNGTLHEAVEGVLPWLDFIAMDIKLPSLSRGDDLVDDHRLFLRATRSLDMFLKMVVDESTAAEEVRGICRRLEGEAAGMSLVLQPVWREGGSPLTPRRAWELARAAAPFFSSVRVIPQAHRIWGAR